MSRQYTIEPAYHAGELRFPPAWIVRDWNVAVCECASIADAGFIAHALANLTADQLKAARDAAIAAYSERFAA